MLKLDTAALLRQDVLSVLDAIGQRVTDPGWKPPALKSGVGGVNANIGQFSTPISDAHEAKLFGYVADDIAILAKTSKIMHAYSNRPKGR